MNVKISHAAWAFAALLTVAACKDNKDTAETKAVDTPTAAPTPTEAPTTEVKTEEPDGPEIPARVKAEVDGKEAADGHTTAMVAAGGKGSFMAPKGWVKSAASGFSIAKAADGKSAFAVAKLGEGDNAADEAGRGVGALGLTECKWAPAEAATLGKDKLAGSVADGVCKQGDAVVRTAYAGLTGADAGIIAVGSWADGGDATPVFNSFRTAKKGAKGGDSTGIAACCAALRGNAASAPLQQKGYYLAAAGACSALINNPQGRAGLAQVRAMLRGANVPSSCR